MTEQEKIKELEEIMDVDEGTLTADSVLEDYVEWDSIAALSFIAMMDEKFHKNISGQEVKTFKTVGDILKIME